MIAKLPGKRPGDNVHLTPEQASRIMREGARDAIADLKRHGIPIAKDPDENGVIRYELPDGTIVDSDPWLGEKYAPVGWFERFGIAPENIPKPSRQRIEQLTKQQADSEQK